MKNEWIKILKRVLIKHYDKHDDSYKNKYNTPEHSVITITTKTKRRRNYTFGGPHCFATVDFIDPDNLYINFGSPLKKPQKISWEKVEQIKICQIFRR